MRNRHQLLCLCASPDLSLGECPSVQAHFVYLPVYPEVLILVVVSSYLKEGGRGVLNLSTLFVGSSHFLSIDEQS